MANIQPSESIIELFDKKINFNFEMEHLCSYEIWCDWKKQNYVSARSDGEMRLFFDGLIPRNRTLDNIIDELVENVTIRDTILSFEPKELKKNNMVKLVKDKYKDKAESFYGFKRTIADIESYFSSLFS